jgi:hypothetical protein
MFGLDVSSIVYVRPCKIDLPPLQGGPVFKRYLGLKPQAESYCPFGAETEFFMELLKVNTYGLKPWAMVLSCFAEKSDTQSA